MTWKLSFISVKKRWQDYVVLLAGLVISVAIFYLFQTMAFNSTFLAEVIPTLADIGIIFQLGTVLLAMITVVYIFYANSFLLSMRKKEYGMYLMLGAKKTKIKQMMAIETLVIGCVSLVIGLVIGLAQGMTQSLMARLDVTSELYQAFSPMAMSVTILFFSILFLFTALLNGLKFSRTKLLQLLKEEDVVETFRPSPLLTGGLTFFSLILLGVGYASLWNLMTLGVTGLVIALFTITFGTFLFFSALFPFVTNRLKNHRRFANKKLRMFTLSQLSFKASSLSRVLGMVAMLVALSLGAVSVGNAFNNYKEALLNQMPYDLVLYNPGEETLNQVDSLSIEKEYTYHIKQEGTTSFFLVDELKEAPIFVKDGGDFGNKVVPYTKIKVGDRYSYESDEEGNYDIMQGFDLLADPYTPYLGAPEYQIVDQATFEQLSGEVGTIHTYQMANFQEAIPVLKTIDQIESTGLEEPAMVTSKIVMYTTIDGLVGGFVFMGVFLGIAFLAMLASCLMFKVLSSAYKDIQRYNMLHKIGVSNSLLSRSIAQEIAVVFFVPGLLGTLHVLFGLKMFELLIPKPYQHIGVPFLGFLVIYFLYYVLTVMLYKNIVLPKK
ncbi:MAG TPA: ABC transporter permease [Enterococcus aquimarinus]|nr:ABC transporter permease [Enterococcus aquimarinus]